mgnify:CR=1 FL=1
MIRVEVWQGPSGNYVRASWMNGLFPMHADVNKAMDLFFLARIAEHLNEKVMVLDGVCTCLGIDKDVVLDILNGVLYESEFGVWS